MDIIKTAESILKSRMDKHAFEINVCLHSQIDEGSLDRLLNLVQKYGNVASQWDILQKIKSHQPTGAELSSQGETDTKDES